MTTLLTAPEGTFTIEEFKRLPLEGRGWELLDGTVVKKELHGAKSGHLTGLLLATIHHFVDEHRLGVTLGPGCGFCLWPRHETVRVPDISVTRHRGPNSSVLVDDYPRIAPDLVVEMLSPFERAVTAVDRIVMFLRAGTRLGWLVDPGTKSVMIFHADTAPALLMKDDTLVGGAVLPGFSMPVAEIFNQEERPS